MSTIQYTNDDGGRAVEMAMLPPPPTKPATLTWQCGFSGGGKKEEFKERSELREDRAYDSGCNSWSPLRDAVGSLKQELIRLWNSVLPEPGQPSAQLSKLIRLTACKKKTKHTISQWYRTVYISWLVFASYDTHKGKRWRNSEPRKPQGEKDTYIIRSFDLVSNNPNKKSKCIK